MEPFLRDLLQWLLFMGVTTILFFFAKVLFNVLTPYEVNRELREDNVAVGLSLSGYLLAAMIVFVGAYLGPSKGLKSDMIHYVGYSLMGLVLLNFSRWINDRLILYKFSNVKEIRDDRNPGTAAVEFGSYVASGLVVAGSIHGEGGGPDTAVVFFLLAQACMVVFTWVYNLLTPFDVHAEIERDNVAAGLVLGGTLIGLGIILLKGVQGNFVSWEYNLTQFAEGVGISLIALPLVRMFLDRVIMPKVNLSEEIARDQNIGVGLLEMSVTIAFALAIYVTVDLTLPF